MTQVDDFCRVVIKVRALGHQDMNHFQTALGAHLENGGIAQVMGGIHIVTGVMPFFVVVMVGADLVPPPSQPHSLSTL